MIRLFASLLILLCLVAPSCAQDATFEEAMALFTDGNYAEARPVAETFAEKNEPRAFFMLGTMSQKGLGVEVDPLTARLWFTKAAEAGNTDGQLALGIMLLDGSLGEPKLADGSAWLEKAAAAGNVQAQYNQALFYSGVYNNKPDWNKAFALFKQAADKGLAEAQYNLALLYTDGRGVEKNAVQAANWFSKAAAQGMPDAALEYGVLVFRGEGVQKDEVLGTKWLTIAAQHGNAVAQNRVARILALGLPGVKQDPIEAMKWNFLAAKQGRGDLELDAATEKADPGMVKDARTRAEAFKPLPDKTPE